MSMPRDELGLLELKSLENTDRLGEQLAMHLPDGSCLALVGTLGAGKTRLAQAVIAALGVERQQITSPTYSLVQIYESQGPAIPARTIYHLDAYRVRDDCEFYELGVEEFLGREGTLTLVEWGDRVAAVLPRETLWLHLEVEHDELRRVVFRGIERMWKGIIQQVIQQVIQQTTPGHQGEGST